MTQLSAQPVQQVSAAETPENLDVRQLDALDLAALLCSRVCHDVISPVGAIINGLEVLDDEKDESMREFAADLIKKSAKQASARLQFARIAFGAAGSAGAEIDLGDAEQVARGFIHDDRTQLSWSAPRAFLPKNQVKLLLNMLLIAQHAIPRGGQMDVSVVLSEEQGPVINVRSKGQGARIPAKAPALVALNISEDGVDAHGVQPYYTGLIAQAAGLEVEFSLDEETVVIAAKKKS